MLSRNRAAGMRQVDCMNRPDRFYRLAAGHGSKPKVHESADGNARHSMPPHDHQFHITQPLFATMLLGAFDGGKLSGSFHGG
jgi:hypothetical protein